MEKLPRPTQPEELLDIKAATRRDLSLARAKAFAMITRVDAPALSKYGSPSELGHFMPVDIMVDLIRDTGSLDLLSTIAGLVGMKLVPIDGDDGCDKVSLGDVGEMMRESGEANSAVLSVVEGEGANCVKSIGRARQELRESMEAKRRVYSKLALRERRIRSAAS